jgi:hypothetical protein
VFRPATFLNCSCENAMRRIIDFVARHHEPAQRWEFNLFAAVGIAVLVLTLCAAAYNRFADSSQGDSVPAAWNEKSEARPVRS